MYKFLAVRECPALLVVSAEVYLLGYVQLRYLPEFEAVLKEFHWKSKKPGCPVYSIRSSDLPLGWSHVEYYSRG